MGDPAIKLFGKRIPLIDSGSGSGSDLDPIAESAFEDRDMCTEMTNNEVKDKELDAPGDPEQDDHKSTSCLNNPNENNQQTSSQDVTEKSDSRPEQEQSESDTSGQEKILKKPDKILPCPRCNSLDTKFCYYNNYNVSQPRHFCKNCQRYWTAGGTMRNVPVGAGRRKNKHSASHYHHVMMSPEGSASARESIDPTHHHKPLSCGSPIMSLKGYGTVLKFGPEVPLCESMSSILNLGEQKKTDINIEEPSCVSSSVTASNCQENGFPDQYGMPGYCNGVTPMHPLQFYPGPPWPYPWSAGWNNVAAAAAAAVAINGSETGNVNSVQWSPLVPPAFRGPTIPVPFMPASFWPWNVPWPGSNGVLSPSSSSNSGRSGNGSPTLGKHSRDSSSIQAEEKTEKSLWIPKTLRIDDPNEAAKSSIWATLGIKPHEGGMFKAFRSKSEESKGQKSDASEVLHANPAALSRSRSFQETT